VADDRTLESYLHLVDVAVTRFLVHVRNITDHDQGFLDDNLTACERMLREPLSSSDLSWRAMIARRAIKEVQEVVRFYVLGSRYAWTLDDQQVKQLTGINQKLVKYGSMIQSYYMKRRAHTSPGQG
jgi:hypothetical protein